MEIESQTLLCVYTLARVYAILKCLQMFVHMFDYSLSNGMKFVLHFLYAKDLYIYFVKIFIKVL